MKRKGREGEGKGMECTKKKVHMYTTCVSMATAGGPLGHTHLPDVLVTLLQLPQLGHGVVAEGLVQGAVPKLVPKVRVRSLLHQQPHYLYVPPLHCQMEGSLLVDVLDIRTGPLEEEGGGGEREGGREGRRGGEVHFC